MKAFKWCLGISLILSLIAIPITTYSGKALGLKKIVQRCFDGVGQCPKKIQQCFDDRDNCWRADVLAMVNLVDPPSVPCPCWDDADLADVFALGIFDSGDISDNSWCDGLGSVPSSGDPNGICDLRLIDVRTYYKFYAFSEDGYQECGSREYSYYGDINFSSEDDISISVEEFQSCKDGVAGVFEKALAIPAPPVDLTSCPCIRDEFVETVVEDLKSGSNGVEVLWVQFDYNQDDSLSYINLIFGDSSADKLAGFMRANVGRQNHPEPDAASCSVDDRGSESGQPFGRFDLAEAQLNDCKVKVKRIWDELCGSGGYFQGWPDYDERCKNTSPLSSN